MFTALKFSINPPHVNIIGSTRQLFRVSAPKCPLISSCSASKCPTLPRLVSTSYAIGLTSHKSEECLLTSPRRCDSRRLLTTTTKCDETRIYRILEENLAERDGFEWHRFKVGSYNAIVQEGVHLKYAHNTLAVLVLNTPSFFENTFKRWLQSHCGVGESVEDVKRRIGPHPIESFFNWKFTQIEKILSPIRAVSICDFEPVKHRLPAVSLPACGHVSGAAYFYHPNDPVTGEKIYPQGLNLHPKYGGYFTFRGVIIFPDITLPIDFKEPEPQKTLDTNAKVIEALELFNRFWMDNRYRNCGNPIEKYSDLQLKYFSTVRRRRWRLIEHWFQ